MSGRSIRIFLVEGTPSALLTAEIMNWSGKIFVAPRTQLPQLGARNEVKRTGVYLLVGDDPDNPLKKRVYVGEADNVLTRLKNHDNNPDKEFGQIQLLLPARTIT